MRLFLILVILFLIDLYFFQAIRTVIQNLSPTTQQVVMYGYWLLFLLTAALVLVTLLNRLAPPSNIRMYFFSVLFIIFACKLLVILFLFAEDLVRIGKVSLNALLPHEIPYDASRSKFLSQFALITAAIPFSAFIYGMVKGAYDYRVKHIKLKFPNLPAAFHGYKILQITDLHTGSFPTTEPLKKAVNLINKQQADLVLFTGDLVNNVASELVPHQETLSQLKAKDGVFSILGNHDYGDYVNWETKEAKIENLNTLKAMQQKMGWKLLLNESLKIEKDGQYFALLGVENWSAKMRFPKYGNLAKTYLPVADAPFKILMSHDPSHWDAEVTQHYPDIDLMLSGHTHGMQFGINFPGFKWSPVQYVYKQWAGLYKKGRQYLYVNTGLGFIGYPGRVGFLPEITVFELQKGN